MELATRGPEASLLCAVSNSAMPASHRPDTPPRKRHHCPPFHGLPIARLLALHAERFGDQALDLSDQMFDLTPGDGVRCGHLRDALVEATFRPGSEFIVQ